jgi:hypothetical protein
MVFCCRWCHNGGSRASGVMTLNSVGAAAAINKIRVQRYTSKLLEFEIERELF